MQGVTRFEDLVAWQKARGLTKVVDRVTREGVFGKDFGLSTQVQHAAVSIMSNIAEGFERNRSGEFHQFLSIAKASCAELRSHLYVALDAGYPTREKFVELLAQAEEVKRVVGGLRASADGKKKARNSARHTLLSSEHSAPSTQHPALRSEH
jgi:four helix bundle protein